LFKNFKFFVSSHIFLLVYVVSNVHDLIKMKNMIIFLFDINYGLFNVYKIFFNLNYYYFSFWYQWRFFKPMLKHYFLGM